MINLSFSEEMLVFLGITIILAWFISQLFKAILNCAIAKNFKAKHFMHCFFADGDFPSSHTCFSVTSLIVAVPYLEEIISSASPDSNDVTICRLIEVLWVLFVFVIVKDAIGVRGSLKKLSSVVKKLLSEPENFLNDNVNENLQSFWTDVAKGININVGHMPHEVIGGLILALIIGVAANAIRLNIHWLLVTDLCAATIYFILTFYILTHKEKVLSFLRNILEFFKGKKR